MQGPDRSIAQRLFASYRTFATATNIHQCPPVWDCEAKLMSCNGFTTALKESSTLYRKCSCELQMTRNDSEQQNHREISIAAG